MGAPVRLPKGRHGISRADVRRSQRERILRAMAEAVAERGYANTPVAAVIARAGVSRETFYEQFENKQACFLAAYDEAARIVLNRVAGAVERDSSEPPRLERGLRYYLEALAGEPAIARTFLVEVYAAGDAALARRAETQARFAAALAESLDARGQRQRFACEAVVGAVSALVTQQICAGQTDRLGLLHPSIARFAADALRASGLDLP